MTGAILNDSIIRRLRKWLGFTQENELKGYWNISALAAVQATDGSTEIVFAPYQP
jgi:hypothetical protein